jgi:hypothetical protein
VDREFGFYPPGVVFALGDAVAGVRDTATIRVVMPHTILRPFVTVLKPAGAKHVALAFAAAAVVLTGGVGDTAKTATAPKLSGTYAMMFTTVCQSDLSISLPQTGLSVIYALNDTKQYAGKGDFTPSKASPTVGTVAFDGWKVAGSPLSVNGGGDSYTSKVQSQTGVSYSLTSNSVTIAGTTYNAVYGAITSGVIQQFTYVGLETDTPNCGTNGVGIIQ